jgi:carbon storage regulator CsrA
MLVLSRRRGQRILFPQADIAVQVISGKGSTVRLGIEAPPGVTVIREELADAPPMEARQTRHDMLGRLNTLTVALHVAEKQLDAGLADDARRTLIEAEALLESLPEFHRSEPRRHKPIEALLVEDNPNEEALLSSYLRMCGVNVAAVPDGSDALEFLARNKRPDFVLLDMRLPRFDGPSTVSAIRRNPQYRGLRIFAVSGSAPTEFGVQEGEAGVDAWFQKPVNPKRLVEAMNAATVCN